MIKVIAFDLVGVLVTEKDIELTKEEDKLERLFGDNVNDDAFFKDAQKNVDNILLSKDFINGLINKIYDIRDKDIFNKIKSINDKIKIIIATNHITLVKDFIYKSFETDALDEIIVSADINKIKPYKNFYLYILNKYHIKPNELLFLDDNESNIIGDQKLGINTIKVNKDTDILKEINEYVV